MALDVVLIPCRFTGSSVVKKNPFTGEEKTVDSHEPLNASEIESVQRVLKNADSVGPDDNGYWFVETENGTAEIACDDLENGCVVTLRGLSPTIEKFLFDLLNAAEWVMLPATEAFFSITTSPKYVKQLPNNLPTPVLCQSPKELEFLLNDGVQAWKKYRDHVLGGGQHD